MNFNFDEIINRKNTNCVKYDGLNRYFGTNDAFPMWVADMDFASPKAVQDALIAKINQRIFGYEELSEDYFDAIINWQKRNYLDLKKEEIAFCSGVVSALSICINAFSEIDDEVIVQSPVYYPFYSVVSDNNRKLIVNNLIQKDGVYYIDFDDLKSQITPKTKMILLCSPHNPVGRIWNKDELYELGEICLKNNIKIICDEIHSDIIFKPFISMASIKQFEEIVIVLNSPSKTFNLAGLNSSYAFSKNKKMILEFKKISKKMAIHANMFSYISTIEAYKQEDWLNELLKYLRVNIEFTNSFFSQKLPLIKPNFPDATYLIWIDFRALGLSQKELVSSLLHKSKIALNDGESFGANGKGFMRMNIATSRINLINCRESIRF